MLAVAVGGETVAIVELKIVKYLQPLSRLLHISVITEIMEEVWIRSYASRDSKDVKLNTLCWEYYYKLMVSLCGEC